VLTLLVSKVKDLKIIKKTSDVIFGNRNNIINIMFLWSLEFWFFLLKFFLNYFFLEILDFPKISLNFYRNYFVNFLYNFRYSYRKVSSRSRVFNGPGFKSRQKVLCLCLLFFFRNFNSPIFSIFFKILFKIFI
jgi:hypothetical protein